MSGQLGWGEARHWLASGFMATHPRRVGCRRETVLGFGVHSEKSNFGQYQLCMANLNMTGY